MAKNYTITFKSLRAGTVYTLSINGGTGTAVPLKPAAEPFSTQEDADEDQFRPVRTQSGYFRIVDDGKDSNGNAFDWKDLIPATDTSRPVILRDGGGTIVWQGFMQAQNFSGVLYGNPQEREFPVQCPLAALNSFKVTTAATDLRNFAYIIHNFLVTNMPGGISFSQFVVQGGNDARAWLLKMIDWQNFLCETDQNDLEPAYTHFDVLEDVCRFWGWTLRTRRQVVYMTCMDDSGEQSLLTMTTAQLATMAGGTSAGTVTSGIPSVALSGDIFASISNDTNQNRGPNRATVKGVCNEHQTVLKVFPTSVENSLKNGGWQWVPGGEDKVGYFETAQIGSFETELMQGYTNGTYGAFSCRQIFTSADADQAAECDMILINHVYNGTQWASVQTKKPMSFCGGSLKLSGTVYFGDYVCDWEEGTRLKLRLGIGMTRQTARWWYMPDVEANNPSDFRLTYGWSPSGTLREFNAPLMTGQIKSTGCWGVFGAIFKFPVDYDYIPIAANEGLKGYIFIDVLGLESEQRTYRQTFQIADFKVEFTRDIIELPTTTGQIRGRVKTEDRVTSRDYMSENSNATREEWNADCIFASDNHMKYGFGLIMNFDGSFMDTAQYGNNQSNKQHPEQHLANRVASYWAATKRMLRVELRTDAITEPLPTQKVIIDGTTMNAVSVSREWRDDVTTLTLLQV